MKLNSNAENIVMLDEELGVDYLDYYSEIKKKYNIVDGKRNIFIIGTPNHGNIGDQAIWYATQWLMEDLFKDSNVVDINIGDFWADIGAIVDLIQRQDMIILHGGGNFGNYYMEDERIRRCVITSFPDHRLIMFPQTIYFSDDKIGREELVKSIRIYEKNKNLVLIARDSHSFEIMRDNFANNVYLLPDVVLSLNFSDEYRQREDILFCFRNDAEGIMSDEMIKDIEMFLRQKGERIRYTDTHVGKCVKKEREHLIASKIEEFQTARLVVTDRLHGMIFSVITGTPCIVFDNFNSKIKNAYKDLKGSDHVIMVDNKEEFVAGYEVLNVKGRNRYDEKPVLEQFARAMEEIMHVQTEIQGQDPIDALADWSLKVIALQEQIKERSDELAVYKDWVSNLQRQNDDLNNDLNAMQDRERQWNIQQRELYDCIKFEREKNGKKRLWRRR